jgi:hypothetical protein
MAQGGGNRSADLESTVCAIQSDEQGWSATAETHCWGYFARAFKCTKYAMRAAYKALVIRLTKTNVWESFGKLSGRMLCGPFYMEGANPVYCRGQRVNPNTMQSALVFGRFTFDP